MKTIAFPISLIALGASTSAFVNNPASRLLARPGFVAPKTLRRATPDAVGTNHQHQDDEVKRLRSMAAQLRAEASAMAAEQALKVSESTQKVFAKLDLNKDGVICAEELKLGLEKAFKKDEIPDSRIQQLVAKFDRNGDGVLQVDEFVTVDTMRNQLDALVREEKALALQESKRAEKEEETKRLKEMQMAILNDGEPTNTEKLVSVAPYLFPLLDSLQYAGFFVTKHPDNVFAQAAALMYTLYMSVPFSGVLAFFLLTTLRGNPSLNRLIRFNAQQAIYLDIALFVPGILALLYGFLASNIPLNLPAEAIEMGSDAVLVAMIASIAYASASSLLGQTPDKIPVLSKAVEKRMLKPEMFDPDMYDEQGRFVGRPSEEEEEPKE